MNGIYEYIGAKAANYYQRVKREETYSFIDQGYDSEEVYAVAHYDDALQQSYNEDSVATLGDDEEAKGNTQLLDGQEEEVDMPVRKRFGNTG